MKVFISSVAMLLATMFVTAGDADAQVRVRGGIGVHIGGPRTRAVVVVGGYRRPYYPFFYFNGYYGPYPYYAPFYWYPPAVYGQTYYSGGPSVRLQVTPREAEVYIDGFYAGIVDDFDGVFQRLHIEPGPHDLTLYLDGYRTVHQQLNLRRSGTFQVHYTMQPLAAGETAEARPEPPQEASPQAGRRGYPPQDPRGYPQDPRGYPPQDPSAEGPGPDRYPPPPPPQRGDRGGPPPRRPGNRGEEGTLSLRVQPGSADVKVDGERWEGPSGDDRLVIQVSPGTHHVEVRREGYRTYMTDINVPPGETATVNISLSRQ